MATGNAWHLGTMSSSGSPLMAVRCACTEPVDTKIVTVIRKKIKMVPKQVVPVPKAWAAGCSVALWAVWWAGYVRAVSGQEEAAGRSAASGVQANSSLTNATIEDIQALGSGRCAQQVISQINDECCSFVA